jgi:hypothetical protein
VHKPADGAGALAAHECDFGSLCYYPVAIKHLVKTS